MQGAAVNYDTLTKFVGVSIDNKLKWTDFLANETNIVFDWELELELALELELTMSHA